MLGQAAAACFLLGRAVWKWRRTQDEEEERFRRFMSATASTTEVQDRPSQTNEHEETAPAYVITGRPVPARSSPAWVG